MLTALENYLYASDIATIRASLGHTKLIFCFSDPAGLFLADLKKKKKKFLINIPDIMIVAGQE